MIYARATLRFLSLLGVRGVPLLRFVVVIVVEIGYDAILVAILVLL